MKNYDIALSGPQYQFVSAKEAYVLYAGGLGSGKTYSGAAWAIYMALTYPNARGMITANTYSQLKKATLTAFFDLADKMGINYKYYVNESKIEVRGGATIYAFSMENYDQLRGVEVGWAWSDECAFYKEAAYQVLIGRIRDKRGPCQWKGTTTPNGFNWLYNRFIETPPKSSRVVYGQTRDNKQNLADSYLESLEEQYDDKMGQQELEGKFVNLTSGKVYYGFDRAKHVQEFETQHGFVYLGLDFNVDPMCGVFANVIGDTIYIFDEIHERDSNTFKVSKTIKDKFPAKRIQIIADSTGDRRKTAASNTDHEILKRAGFDVLPFKNPFIKDRQNNINRLFHFGKIVIHPRCKKLILDLEQLVHENKDESLGHITDGLGYLAWKMFPLMAPKKQVEIRTY